MAVASAETPEHLGESRTREERRSSWSGLLPLTAAAVVAALVVAAVLAWGALNRGPGDGSVEAGFARDMSTHHAQAVEMALLLLTRSEDPAMRLLATDIAMTQQHQLGQMLGWLDLWDLSPTGDEPAMAWMGHPTEGPMPGMATREELNRLGELSGVGADREFLRLMIRHHEGGVPMAQAAIERSDEEVVVRLARSIIGSQTAEVRTMEAMLAERGGEAAS